MTGKERELGALLIFADFRGILCAAPSVHVEELSKCAIMPSSSAGISMHQNRVNMPADQVSFHALYPNHLIHAIFTLCKSKVIYTHMQDCHAWIVKCLPQHTGFLLILVTKDWL